MLRLEYRTPDELADNPQNWRMHPAAQTQALAGAIGEVGWAGACLYNERTGRLIDGHARKNLPKELLVDGKLPVLIGSWSEADEAKILATLDPLAAMAEASADKLDSLLREVQTGSDALAAMLKDLQGPPVLDFSEPPESVQENAKEIEEIKKQRRAANDGTESKMDTEKYLVVVYPTREAKEAALKQLGLPADERYLPANTVELRARRTAAPVKAAGGRAAKAADPKKSGAGG